MSDCFFEYDYRWPQLSDALLSGDERAVREAVALLEERDRRLEDHLRNPCGGGGGGGAVVWAATPGSDDTPAGDGEDTTVELDGRASFALSAETPCFISAGVEINGSQFDDVLFGIYTELHVKDHSTSSDIYTNNGTPSRTLLPNVDNFFIDTLVFGRGITLPAGSHSLGLVVRTVLQGATLAPTQVTGLWLTVTIGGEAS